MPRFFCARNRTYLSGTIQLIIMKTDGAGWDITRQKKFMMKFPLKALIITVVLKMLCATDFPGGPAVKSPPCKEGDSGLITG